MPPDNAPVVAAMLDPAGLRAVIWSFPGPALRLSAQGAVIDANPAAGDLVSGDPACLCDLADWLENEGVVSGFRSTPVETARGLCVIEWAATTLADRTVLLFGRDSTLERQLRHTLTESRQRYKDLVEASSDFAWETGPDGHFVFVSPYGALGFGANALIGRAPRDLVVDEWGDIALPFDTRGPVDQVELWLKTADGGAACVVVSALPLFGAQGEWIGARGVCRDITEQVTRTHELTRVRNREKLLAHVVHTLRDRLDPSETLNEAALQTMGALGGEGCRIYRTDDLGALSLAASVGNGVHLPALACETVVGALAEGATVVEKRFDDSELMAIRTEYRQTFNGALLVWRGLDHERWDEDDRLLMAGVADHLGIAHAHLAYQERLLRLSERDGLTGLFNRRTFYDRLSEAMRRPDSGCSALLYVDLDNFKAVNDHYGHQQGDAALKAVAKLLVAGVRPGDIAGRVGGDEFVLWLGRVSEDEAIIVARRLLDGIGELQHLSVPERPLGLSIGIAVHYPDQSETVQELADRADQAMYVAKQGGKNTYYVAPAGGQQGQTGEKAL